MLIKRTLFLSLILALSVFTAHSTVLDNVKVDGITYEISYDLEYKLYAELIDGKECSGSVTIPSSVNYLDKPASVTSIGISAFSGCTGLTSISIPTSVTKIKTKAFENCSGLTSANIPNSITNIGSNAFYGCSSLSSISIPKSVTTIEDYAFSRCSGLTSITVDAENSVYDSRVDCNAIILTASNKLLTGCMNTTIPNSVTTIASYAFSMCTGLTSVNIPAGVTNIGNYAFTGCDNLVSITVAGGNSIYDSRNDCNAIIITASNKLFFGCKGTVIPNTVTSISSNAFDNCTGLTSITIPNSVTSIDNYAFNGCSGLASIIVADGNSTYDSRDNCNAIITTASNTLYLGCKNTVIPNSVTSIGDVAFWKCSGLTSITIPNSVTTVGMMAFAECDGLTAITIPNSITSLGYLAFDGCKNLKTVTLNSNTIASASYSTSTNFRTFFGDQVEEYIIGSSVTSITPIAFYNASNLKTITVEEGNTKYDSRDNCNAIIETSTKTLVAGFKNTVIPSSVKAIGESAYSNWRDLTSISIPNNITSIGDNAFNGCKLEKVLANNPLTTVNANSFSDKTLQHAMLYIPYGTWGQSVYDGGWYRFYNIREVTTSQLSLSQSRAYTMMNAQDFKYAVYNKTDNNVNIVNAFYSVDEDDPNSSWQVIDKPGGKYIKNIGSKKYLNVLSNGELSLSDSPVLLKVTDTDNGLSINGTKQVWVFVTNYKLAVDFATDVRMPKADSIESGEYYSIDGVMQPELKEGLNIIRTQDGTVKKVLK